MKVLLLASGRSYHATRWANALAARGVTVGFATVHKVERPLASAVTVFQLSERGARGYVLDVPRLRAVIRRWQPDILHAHYATGYGLMSKLAGFVPRIVSIYGTDIYAFPRRSPLHRAMLAYALAGAQVLSTSEAMADEYVRCYPRRARPTVTPFGVDLELFRPAAEAPAAAAGVCQVGIVKKLEYNYGVDVLLEAFARARAKARDQRMHLQVVGGGSARAALQAQCDALGLADAVTFHGPVPNSEVPARLQGLDVFVVPSRSESFGVAAVEAMACGVPVVASDVGGLPEVVRDGETGLVVPAEDPQALADAIIRLCSDPQLRAAYASAARRRVQQVYDWHENVSRMLAIYRKQLDG